MAWSDLFAGLAFYLIIEGLLPFAVPNAWRRGVETLARLTEPQLRAFGLAVTIAGLVLLFAVRG